MSVDRQWLIDALSDALEALSDTVERLEDDEVVQNGYTNMKPAQDEE